MKTSFFFIALIIAVTLLSSCSFLYRAYIRNYTSEPIKITKFYHDEWYEKLDTVRSSTKIIKDINMETYKEMDNIILGKGDNPLVKNFSIPENNTVFFGTTRYLEKLIIEIHNRTDTIIFEGKYSNYRKYVKEGSLSIKTYPILKRLVILDVK